MRYTIIDTNIDRDDFDDEEEYLEEAQLFVGDEEEFRNECCELLQDYFEVCSDYGDPVEMMIDYIPTDNLISLMEDINYEITKEEE